MSHSTKLALGGGGGGTLDRLTANVGLPAVPDGDHNINIVGTGVIQTIVDPLAPNTIRIESSQVAATFDCDTGSAVPAAGAIDIIGTIAQIETTGFGSTVQLALADNINIVGTLDTGSDIKGGGSLKVIDDIITATGDISAPLGNATIGGNITASDLDITGAATIAGPLQLSWLLHGVLRVDNDGIVTSSDGENGQLLIGSSTGPSQWRNLTPGTGIQIIEDANSITLSVTDILARTYATDVGNALPAASILTIHGGRDIHTSGAGSIVTVELDENITPTTVTATTISALGTIQAVQATITGILNAGSLVTTTVNVSGAITCDNLSAASDIIAGNDLTVNHDATVGGDLEVTGDIIGHEDAVIPGDLRLSGHTDGVLITNTTGFIDASNGSPTGTNGQILISGGARPTWHALESDDGSVAITYPGDNRINLRAAGATPSVLFNMVMRNTVSWAANNVEVFYDMGKKLALTILRDTAAACYPGDGIDQAAYFNPPYNGYYLIKAQITVRKTAYWECKNAVILIEDYTIGHFVLDNRQYLASAFNGAGTTTDPYTATLSITGIVHLTPGHHYGVRTYLHTRSDAISQHYTLGSVYDGIYTDSMSNFQGFLVYRL